MSLLCFCYSCCCHSSCISSTADDDEVLITDKVTREGAVSAYNKKLSDDSAFTVHVMFLVVMGPKIPAAAFAFSRRHCLRSCPFIRWWVPPVTGRYRRAEVLMIFQWLFDKILQLDQRNRGHWS